MTTRIRPRHPSNRRFLLVFVAAAAVVGCAQAPDASPWSGHRLFRDDSWEFPVCRDLPELAAPPEAYQNGLTGRLKVDADLSAPGAVADPSAIDDDASLAKALRSGAEGVEPGDARIYRFDARCGIEWLGEVNGVAWRTDELMPERWESAVAPHGAVKVTITLQAEPEPLIEATAHGKTIVYKPTLDEERPKCDQP